MAVQQPRSGAGAIMGAIAGGAMGNAIGNGGGRAAATMLGIMGGAIVGDRVEGGPQAQLQNVQRCSVQTFYENRTTAYNVVYEYAGKQYAVQMPNDPGPTIRLQVSPVGASAQTTHAQDNHSYSQQMYGRPANEVVTQQPGYYTPSYYAPAGVQFDTDYEEYPRGHRRWR